MPNDLALYDALIAGNDDTEIDEEMAEIEEEPALQFGFEFELQLMLKFSTKMRKKFNVAPEDRFQTVNTYLNTIEDINTYRLSPNIILAPHHETIDSDTAFALRLDPAFFAPHTNIFSDVGNIEIINTTPQLSIEKALDEINVFVELITSRLWKELKHVCDFALLLPTITIARDIHAILATSKHLNVSSIQMNKFFVFETLAKLQQSAPHYFQTSDSGEADQLYGASITSDSDYDTRLHIQLPYEFNDYETLLEGGKVHLPSIEYLEAGGIWGSPILISYSENAAAPRYAKWHIKNLVV